MYKYIVIEWIHGAGKTTIAKALAKRLRQNWENWKYYHFPDEDSKLGQVIRKSLADDELFDKWQVVGLLFAAFSNRFHIKTANDETVYVTDRDSVTTGFVFQNDMKWSTRLENYKYGIESLKNKWIVIYLKVDANKVVNRIEKRRKENAKKGWVWADKSKDKFLKKRAELAKAYDKNMWPSCQKAWIDYKEIENDASIDETVDKIINIIQN